MNPFDALDDAQLEGDVLVPAPRPSLLERFSANRDVGYYTGTFGGAVKGSGTQAFEREQAVKRYDTLPQWETPMEGIAALAGQLSSQFNPFEAPENFVPIGLGAKVISWSGTAAKASLRARVAAGAIDAGAANLALDSAIQGIEIGHDTRETFDPVQLAASVAIGAGVGGLAGGAFGRRAVPEIPDVAAPRETPAVEPVAAPEAVTPEPVTAVVDPVPMPEPLATVGEATGQLVEPITAKADTGMTVMLGDELDAKIRVAQGLPPRPEPQPAPRAEVKVYTLDNAIGSDEPITVRVVRTGKAIAVDDGHTLVDVTKIVESGKSPEEAIAMTFGDHPQGAVPDISKVRPQMQSAPAELAAKPRGPLTGAPARAQGGTAAVPASPAVTRLMDISNALVDALDGIVRQGRISNPKALGIYKTMSGVVRLRKPDDFDVLSHELGHHIEVAVGAPVKTLMQAHAAELRPLAYAGAKKGTELEEGFAEFVRLMLTNPRYAAMKAPNFDTAIRAALSQGEFAKLGQAIDQAQAAYRAWLDQPSTEAVASTIVSSKETGAVAKAREKLDRYGLGHTVADYLHRAYEGLVDDLNPFVRGTRFLARIMRDKNGKPFDLKVNDDPGKLARLSRQSYQAGHQDLIHGVHGYGQNTPSSASFRDATILAQALPNVLSRWNGEMATRFGGYLWSRRALGEWDRFDKGLIPNAPDKLTKGDHGLNVTEMEAAHPQFRQAAVMIYDWNNALWLKKKESGLITEEQWLDGLQIKDYVPGQRAFDQDYDALGTGSGAARKTSKSSIVKRFQGSRRDVINPLESMMRDAYETSMAIARNDVIKALDRLARQAGPGGGKIAELIPSKEIKATVIDPLEAFTSAAKASGMSTADIIAMRDSMESAIGDQKASVFRPAIINEKGEPIIFFRDGGELKALRLADGEFGLSMYRAYTGMTPMQQNLWVNMLAKSAQVLRLGIVGDLGFAVVNFIRDQTESALLYGQPLKRLALSFKGMYDDMFVTDAARAYNHAGGIMGGAGVAALDEMRVNRDLSSLRRKGVLGSRVTTLKGIIGLTEITETGTRFANFKIFKAEAMKRGLSDVEASIEAAHRATDVLAFNRHGAWMTAPARIIPFLNVGMQGPDKIVRHTLLPFFRDVVTTEDAAARALAVKTWARLSALTMLGMGLHAINSEDDYYRDTSPYTKATNWMFKVYGEWYAVPKPYSTSVMLNLGEAAYTAAKLRDPRWADQYLEGLSATMLPPNLLEGNPIISESFELTTNTDLFTGQPIVSDENKGMEPWLQYTNKTSQMARDFGKVTGTSPEIVDHIILGFTASYGKTAMSLYDAALSDKPAQGWDDWPITRRFAKDVSRGASSSRAFWDLVSSQNGKLEQARRSWQHMIDAGDQTAAADYLASRDDRTKIWIAAGSIDAEVRRIHPFDRARRAVQAISEMRKALGGGPIETADGTIELSRSIRGTANDILGDLQMTEARNALVMMGEPGWSDRQLIDVTTFHRELSAVSPDLAEALADRFASAKVLPMKFIQEAWPDLRDRLKADGSIAVVADLSAVAAAEGFEMGGVSIPKPERGEVPGLAEIRNQ